MKVSILRVSRSSCSASRVTSRSRAPAVKAVTTTRLPWPCSVRTWAAAASNTLRPSPPERSRAKFRPTRPPNERTWVWSASLDLLEGRHVAHDAAGLLGAPLLTREEHGGRRHRLVGRRAEGQRFQPLHPRLVVVGDQRQPLAHRLLGEVIEADRRAADIVEQRLQSLVEQRQPMLHAGVALAGADRLVERIVRRRRAESLDIAAAEALLGLAAERHLAHRHQRQLLHDLARALRLGIEGLDVLERVAEEIEAHGTGAAGRKEIEDAAAHRVFAGLHDGAGALEAGEVEPLHELGHVEALARRDVLQGAADELAGWKPLQDGVDGGQHHGRPLARGGSEAGHGGDAGGDDLGVGADAVVGHRVPGRHLDDAQLGREERQALRQCLQPPVVAGDVQQQRRRGAALLLGQPRQHHRRQPFRHTCERLSHVGVPSNP